MAFSWVEYQRLEKLSDQVSALKEPAGKYRGAGRRRATTSAATSRTVIAITTVDVRSSIRGT
jgi:hypothetical protein